MTCMYTYIHVPIVGSRTLGRVLIHVHVRVYRSVLTSAAVCVCNPYQTSVEFSDKHT